MKKPYHIVTRAARESAVIIEQFCRASGQILLLTSFSAVGVDREGKKHILGIEPGATENAASVKRLLTHLRDQGLPTDRKYLFVIDGAKALRAAIEEVFGTEQPVQRCHNHKMRNVLNELPKEQYGQNSNLMRAAWKVKTAEDGEKRLERLARFLEREHESAGRSLREGMQEMFTLQRFRPGYLRQGISAGSTVTQISARWRLFSAARAINLRRRK